MILFRLRPNLTSNWSLAFASIVIAGIIWLIAKQGQITDKDLIVPISFNAPENVEYEISPKLAIVSIVCPISQAQSISNTSCIVQINPADLGDLAKWRTIEFKEYVRLDKSMIVPNEKMADSIQIRGVRPFNEDTVTIAGRLLTTEAKVVARTRGTPAKGYCLGNLAVEPQTLTLTGAPDALERLGEEPVVLTAPIDIAGRKQTLEERVEFELPENIAVVAASPDSQKRVSVIVAIEELRGETRIEGVRIVIQPFSVGVVPKYKPQTTTVTVDGPLSLIADLKPEDFTITLKEPVEEEPGPERNIGLDCQFHKAVVPKIRENVRILGIDPKSVSVRMEAVEKPKPQGVKPAPVPTPRLTPLPHDTPTSSSTNVFSETDTRPVSSGRR